MKNNYPWYDSQWLNAYVQAKKLIKQHQPALLNEFVNTMDVLKTRSDFQVKKLPNILNEIIINEIRGLIDSLLTDELEKQELFDFGRLVVHNHPYINQLQNTMTGLASEITRELVEPYYNFLSLYNNLSVCGVHMDAPFSKWTLDICIEQSNIWPIYLSQVLPWPENTIHIDKDWESKIKNDPANNFKEYNLEAGEGIVFSGSSQWHYRNRITQIKKENYCHLIFFHFIPKGTKEILEPSNWAGLFGLPELLEIIPEKGDPYAYSISELIKK